MAKQSRDEEEEEEEDCQVQFVEKNDNSSESGDRKKSRVVKYLERVPLSGQLLTLVCAFIFTGVAALVKLLDEVDPFLLAGIRNCFVLFLALPFVVFRGIPLIPTRNRTALMIRIVCGTINLSLMYYSFRHLPLGDCRMISATSPVFVTIYARIFLKEEFGVFEVVKIVFTLVGVVIVMQPPIIFGRVDQDDQEHHFWAAGVAFIATLFAGGVVTSVRALKHMDEYLITTWNNFFGIFLPLGISFCLGTAEVPSFNNLGIIVVISVLSFVGQILMVISLKLDDASSISVARKSEDILLAYLIQIAYFNQIPTTLSLLGAAIILFFVLLTAVRKMLQKSGGISPPWSTLLCLP